MVARACARVRVQRNNFFVEKNPTIVTFPLKNLEMKPCARAAVGCSHRTATDSLVASADVDPASLAAPAVPAIPTSDAVAAMGVAELKALCARARLGVEVRARLPGWRPPWHGVIGRAGHRGAGRAARSGCRRRETAGGAAAARAALHQVRPHRERGSRLPGRRRRRWRRGFPGPEGRRAPGPAGHRCLPMPRPQQG